MRRTLPRLLLALLFIALCACSGRANFKSISATDPVTGSVLTLPVRAKYSLGDIAHAGGASFTSRLTFEDLVGVAERLEGVELVERHIRDMPGFVDHAGIFVPEADGTRSAYYLSEGRFFGAAMWLKHSALESDAEALAILFPYYLLADRNLFSPTPTFPMLEGAQYRCVLEEDVREAFSRFYQLTGHYEMRETADEISLIREDDVMTLRFVTHADVLFVSVTLEAGEG